MANLNLLKNELVLLVGSSADAEPYKKALKENGAHVIIIDEEIDWSHHNAAGKVGGPILFASDVVKPAAVVIVNPGLPENLQDMSPDHSILRFSNTISGMRIPVIIQGDQNLSQGMRRFLEGQGAKYCHNTEEKSDDLPAIVYLAIDKMRKRDDIPGLG